MEVLGKDSLQTEHEFEGAIRGITSEGSVRCGTHADGIITVDSNGRILSLNIAAEVLTGWTTNQLRGRFFEEAIQFRKLDSEISYKAFFRHTQQDNLHLEMKTAVSIVGRDGEPRLVLCAAAPVLNKSFLEIGKVFVFRSVGCLERLEQERIREQNLASLGNLAGGIAHNFNNALTGILANISLAKIFAPVESDLNTILTEAEKATFQARDLTRKLLTFAPGGIPIKKRIYLPDVIQKVVQTAFKGSAIKYDLIVDQNLWPVDIDEQQIRQGINNIILNAVQAMPGGGQLRVRLENLEKSSLEADNPLRADCVKMSITDNGEGISSEALDRIFDPYYSTRPKASGLGLTITHSIITKHGGHIRVTSTEGLGTLVELFLPVQSNVKSTPSKPSTGSGERRGKILVMDDEEIIRNICVTGLKKYGYQVEATEDGNSALNAYQLALQKGDPFDMVILDLVVPSGMNGQDTLEELIKINPNVKTILTSGYSEESALAEYRVHGFTEALVKPFNISQLVQTIASLETDDE